MSLAIWDHTELPATRHKWMRPALTPASKLVLDLPTQGDGRLSWPRLPGNAPTGSRTRDLSITGPTPHHYATEPTQRRRMWWRHFAATAKISASNFLLFMTKHWWGRIFLDPLYIGTEVISLVFAGLRRSGRRLIEINCAQNGEDSTCINLTDHSIAKPQSPTT